jgi:hypothetical protein
MPVIPVTQDSYQMMIVGWQSRQIVQETISQIYPKQNTAGRVA